MKIRAIKQLLHYSEAELEEAIQAILEGNHPTIPVEGEDEGEKLTHLLSAQEIKKNIRNGMSETEALRQFINRVRKTLE